jgi:adenylate cyclase
MALSTKFKSSLRARGTTWGSRLLAALSVFSVVFLYYQQNPFLEAFEAKTYDLRFKHWRGPIPPSDNIAIIAIDEKSIAELGRFPWSRTAYIRLLEQLNKSHIQGLLIDAFFPEVESPKVDRAFAAALKKAGNVTLAVAYELDPAFQVIGSTHSLAAIEAGAAGLGHINFLPDEDGTNRRNLLLVEADGKQVPSLGLAGAMMALGERELSPETFGIRLGQREIPTDGSYVLWVNYTGRSRSYPYYSFTDILHGRVAAEMLEGKLLFLGATALGIYDMRVTPFDGNSPGVEVHATVADNIISGRFIRQSGLEALFDILFILLLGFATYYLTIRVRLYAVIPVVVLLSGGYLWITYQAFLAGHWLNMIYPPLAAAIALLSGGGYRYLVLDYRAREMRSMFSSYLSPKLVARLEREPDLAKIGGDNKEITVLFTDIKGFTSFSEKHTPQEVVARLNEYLDAMVHVIDRFDGTVDKFIGDGIMVYWGAPLPQPDHARLAIDCVLAMEATMRELCAGWERAGKEPFSLRAGIQSGEVVAGNIGSRGKKMEYTVIGDTVNMAARLEGTAKYYGVEFLVGENTCLRASNGYRYRELDKIRMLGKETPVTVYELVGSAAEAASPLIELFATALQLYRERQWEAAREGFAAILQQFPTDRPSRIYLDRCDYFTSTPPAVEWDGVFNRLDK